MVEIEYATKKSYFQRKVRYFWNFPGKCKETLWTVGVQYIKSAFLEVIVIYSSLLKILYPKLKTCKNIQEVPYTFRTLRVFQK